MIRYYLLFTVLFVVFAEREKFRNCGQFSNIKESARLEVINNKRQNFRIENNVKVSKDSLGSNVGL